MPKPNAHLSIVRLDDMLDTSIRKASWRKARKKPNGQLDGATYYWPANVKRWLSRIERASLMLRRYECSCDNKQRKAGAYCEDTYDMARIVMDGLHIQKRFSHGIADAFACLAHHQSHVHAHEDPE